MDVPDNFTIPPDLEIVATVDFTIPHLWNLSVGSASISSDSITWTPTNPTAIATQLGNSWVSAGEALLKGYADQQGFGALYASVGRTKTVFNALTSIQNDSFAALNTLLTNGDRMSAAQISQLTDQTLGGAFRTALGAAENISGNNAAVDSMFGKLTQTYTTNLDIREVNLTANVRVTLAVASGGDASGTQSQVVIGNVDGAAITTGSGNDVILLTGGVNQVSAGAGDDRIAVASGVTGKIDGGSGHNSVIFDDTRVKGTPANLALSNISTLAFVDGRVTTDPDDTAGQVFRLYQAALDRVPDFAGESGWSSALDGGVRLQDVAAGFVSSPEFHFLYGNPNDDTYVSELYMNVLHRAPDAAGAALWKHALQTGATRADVLVGFSESAESKADTSSGVAKGLWVLDPVAAQVARLYDTTLHRHPDLEGLTFWENAIKGGTTLHDVINDFINSNEFKATYGNLNNSDFIKLLYINTLHRPEDAPGATFWVNGLNNGMSRADVVGGFSESPEHVANTASSILNGVVTQ